MRAAIKAGERKSSVRKRARKIVMALAKIRLPCTKRIDGKL